MLVNVFNNSSILFKDKWKWTLTTDDEKKLNEIIKIIGLENRKNVKIENLSSGEIQKANIGLGLLSDADLFLLDEPTSNMDLVNQIRILDMIKNLTNSNITSVIIMHDLNLSSSYGDYFIGINPNHKIVSGNKQEFFNENNLNDIYNIKYIFIKIIAKIIRKLKAIDNTHQPRFSNGKGQ